MYLGAGSPISHRQGLGYGPKTFKDDLIRFLRLFGLLRLFTVTSLHLVITRWRLLLVLGLTGRWSEISGLIDALLFVFVGIGHFLVPVALASVTEWVVVYGLFGVVRTRAGSSAPPGLGVSILTGLNRRIGAQTTVTLGLRIQARTRVCGRPGAGPTRVSAPSPQVVTLSSWFPVFLEQQCFFFFFFFP